MLTHTAHPFAHLGPAPYRFVGLQTTEDRETLNADLERNGQIFTTNMCGGSCDHCGTAIWNVYTFEAADGRRFKVGETCAEKAGEGQQAKDGKRDHKRARREAEYRANAEARREAERDANEAAGFGRLTDVELANLHAEQAEAERQAWEAWKLENSAHVGAIGERVKDVVVRWEGEYSYTQPSFSGFGVDVITLYFLRTLDGHAMVWKTSSGIDCARVDDESPIRKGETFRASFTVKKHCEYRGQRQTTIARLVQPKPKAVRGARAKALAA